MSIVSLTSVKLSPSATIDATNASNITGGQFPPGVIGSGLSGFATTSQITSASGALQVQINQTNASVTVVSGLLNGINTGSFATTGQLALLSGYSSTQLGLTGAALLAQIIASGNVVTAQTALTGSNLQNRIVSASGVLQAQINAGGGGSVSGAVLVTGNQNISGSKTFNSSTGLPGFAIPAAITINTPVTGLTNIFAFNLTGTRSWAFVQSHDSAGDFRLQNYDNAGNNISTPISFQRNNGQVNIGMDAGISFSTNTGKINTKKNLNIRVVNVRDFGAAGDGTTDDTTAINNAVATLTNYSALYFPSGKYRITAGITAITSLSNVVIYGDGQSSEIYNNIGASGGNTFVIAWGCSYFEFYNLKFTGSATVRGSGIHIRLQSTNSWVHNCSFAGCSDFAVHVTGENNGWTNDCAVTDCFFGATLGDGVHVASATDVLVANNVCDGTGDDSLAVVADYTAYQPNRVTFIGNKIKNAGAGGSGCGIRVCEAVDVVISNNTIWTSCEAGIRVTRNTSTTAYSARIKISGNTLLTTGTVGSQTGAIEVFWTNGCMISDNSISQTSSGSGISFNDCNYLTITSNSIDSQTNGRAIFAIDFSVANTASTWDKIFIVNNVIRLTLYEAIYVAPTSGITISNLIIANNTCMDTPYTGAGNYIVTNRLGTAAKIMNNISLEGQGISNGGAGVAPTTANNN